MLSTITPSTVIAQPALMRVRVFAHMQICAVLVDIRTREGGVEAGAGEGEVH